jgi:predicted pyridoxine 5'-phosphate oxidase superfamily flavin-nucleotide-binding protein
MSYYDITFTPNVHTVQRDKGSPLVRFKPGGDQAPMRLGPNERQFVEASDGFYVASVSETGWPYIQFRGGPAGFARTLDEASIAWAELRGNRQYITMGNLAGNDKVALFIIDHARKQRLKILGHARMTSDSLIVDELETYSDRGHIEGAFVITVEAFDWNCPDHITPRFTEAEFGSELGTCAVG